MLKAYISSSPTDAGVKHKGSQTTSIASQERSSRRPFTPPRMSVLASVKIPYLRRLELGDGAHAHKAPLLTLKLSSHSFLDASLKDDISPTPLYTIRTVGATTTVIRNDPWGDSSRAADIKWPKVVPIKGKSKHTTDGILLQLRGSRWKGGNSFLKPSTSKDGPRKFDIPHYSHSVKWQKHGTAYWCTTSPVKGPIAILDPSVDSLPARLTVYETLHDKYDTRPMLVHQGVSILLLDYLLVTAILLVADVQEWMVVQSPGNNSPASLGDQSSNSGLQWRKIVYGEPLFPKLSPAATQYASPGGFDYSPPTPTSQDQMAKIIHGEPLYPRRQKPPSPQLSFSSDSEDEGDDNRSLSLDSRARSPSLSAESILYPLSNPSTSSHTYNAPSCPPIRQVPPIQSIPSDYGSHARSISPAPTTRSATSRILPAPPPSVEPSAKRPTIRNPVNMSRIETHTPRIQPSGTFVGPADASLWERRPPEAALTRARSMSRPLPRTPNAPGGGSTRAPVIRRVQSHTRINQADFEKPWLSTPPPPLPPLTLSPSTPRTGRSLPPTPLDIAMGRAVGGVSAVRAGSGQRPRKPFENEEDQPEWIRDFAGDQNLASGSSYDHPPPAYTSIDFHAAAPQQ